MNYRYVVRSIIEKIVLKPSTILQALSCLSYLLDLEKTSIIYMNSTILIQSKIFCLYRLQKFSEAISLINLLISLDHTLYKFILFQATLFINLKLYVEAFNLSTYYWNNYERNTKVLSIIAICRFYKKDILIAHNLFHILLLFGYNDETTKKYYSYCKNLLDKDYDEQLISLLQHEISHFEINQNEIGDILLTDDFSKIYSDFDSCTETSSIEDIDFNFL